MPHLALIHVRAALIVGAALALLFMTAGIANASAHAEPRDAAHPLTGITVAVDPGHNPGNYRHGRQIARLVSAGNFRKACDTTGTAAPGGMSEARLNLRVAFLLRNRLRQLGARVILTQNGRRPSWGPCINRRARIGNRADVAISIHADGSLAAGPRGFHIIRPRRLRGLTTDIYADSKRFARLARGQLLRGTSLPTSNYVGRRGIIARSDIGGLNLSNVPKILVEMGNMKSRRDMRTLRRRRGQQRVAMALARAIVSFTR